MTVTVGSIVERLNVIEEIRPGEVSCLVDAFADALLLQATEKGLRQGFVPAVATSAHVRL